MLCLVWISIAVDAVEAVPLPDAKAGAAGALSFAGNCEVGDFTFRPSPLESRRLGLL